MEQASSTVLVIGASGFVGKHLARALLADGHTVRCLARDTTRVEDLAEAGCEVVQGDILEPATVERALDSVRAVYVCIHTLSPQGPNSKGQDFTDIEDTGLRTIVQACGTQGVRRLIYVTSIGVAPDAPSAWLRGRWHTEQYLFTSGLDVSVIRPGMVVGRGGTGFDAIARGARGPVAIGLGNGTQQFRTVAVDDVAYYLVGVLDDPRSYGQHYDVGSDDVLTTGQMIDIAAEQLGRRRPIKLKIPSALLGVAAPLVERVGKLPRGSIKGFVDGLRVDMSGDATAIRTILPRVPQSYRQAAASALSHASTR